MTKCHSVPSEGRTLQCDVRTTPEGGRGWIISSHTALCTEGGGECRKDGDENVEDFTPGGIVVESSHSVKGCF